ncbi:unnamed protein product [Toxocara canis]|uniref:Lysophospholipid acyltransferase 5 n=1 Tax=Toxocara canis TaxID=6265 RepID=A0A3P7GV40_TOXCA|nr:unnamed protein product [Toxocara canis]
MCTVLFSGYPLAAIYRTFVYNKAVTVQHLYFVIVGIALYLFNCVLLSTIFQLIINHREGVMLSFTTLFPSNISPRKLSNRYSTLPLSEIAFFLKLNSATVLLIFGLGHLLVGYWFAESDQYDITWTTPFCIMTLRFIGLVMDVYDGQKPKDKLKPDQLKTAIVNPPGLLEIAAYGLFFSGTFVGPQFPLARFRAFVNGEFLENGQVRVSGLMPSLGRFVAGCFYAVIHQWGAMWIPCDYFNTREFFEGAAILAGIGYNGKDENGADRWDGVRDVHILGYEFGMDFQSVIDSFNVGTNTFAKNHIFKRLRWLGNRNISHLVTLAYLAVWHGYHLGYFILFAFEFSCVLAQDQLYGLIRQTPGASEFFAQKWLYPFKVIVGRIIINVAMGTGFLSFGLVKTRIWIKPLLSVYFFGHITAMVVWPIVYALLKRILPRKTKQEEEIAKKWRVSSDRCSATVQI